MSFDDKIFTWNPWVGCHQCSTGCTFCPVFKGNKYSTGYGDRIKINKNAFRLPVQKQRDKTKKLEKYELKYKIPSGSIINVCESSDFFIAEADVWRTEAWEFIHERQDCLFRICTKRPERINQCLPDNWLDGYLNVCISTSVEDKYNAWLRIPELIESIAKHKELILEPLIENIDISPFLSSGVIDKVIVGGEVYNGWDGLARGLEIQWIKDIRKQCIEYDTEFEFISTGTKLIGENGKPVYIKGNDTANLADFYKLNLVDNSISWESMANDIEKRLLAEDANRIYRILNNTI